MMPTTAVIRSIGLWVQFFLHLYISNFVRYHGRKYVCLLLLSFPPNLMTTKKKKTISKVYFKESTSKLFTCNVPIRKDSQII